MSQLNVNDTDDLFKRASEEYPLRTDSSDWNKLAAALQKDPSLILPPSNESEDKRRRKRFFWLFFLLPLGGLGYYSWHTRTAAPAAIASEKPVAKTEKKSAAATGLENGGTAATGGPAVDATDGQVVKNTAGKRQVSNSATKSEFFYGVRGKGASKDLVTAGNSTSGKNTGSGVPETAAVNEADATKDATTSVKDATTSVKVSASSVKAPASSVKAPASGKGDASMKEAGPSAKEGSTSTKEGSTSGKDAVPGKDGAPAKDKDLVATSETRKDTIARKDTSAQKPATAAKARSKNKNQHYFYAGALIAPDLSTVKFQSVKGMGYTTGILLGYSFSPRWSIETGVYLDEKKYYTDGQYFSKKKVQALWGLNLQNVDGSCNMIEIPLNARYNLNTSEKHKWFVTTGLATYLMYKETYNFQLLSSTGYPWSNAHTYNNPSQSWFSQISLSMGYEQKLGKIGNLRLEPYLRIPLAGIGTGSLPISSAGLNVGLTHSFR